MGTTVSLKFLHNKKDTMNSLNVPLTLVITTRENLIAKGEKKSQACLEEQKR